MSLLIAITHDVTGHTTYYAMRSGADFVINLAIPGGQQSNLLSAHLRGCPGREPEIGRNLRLEVVPTTSNMPPRSGAGAPNPTPVQECGPRTSTTGHTTADPGARRRALSRFDTELADMLRTHMTVAEIARHNYVSERSMYRRIRALYNILGVTSRVELTSSTNRVGPDRDPAAMGA